MCSVVIDLLLFSKHQVLTFTISISHPKVEANMAQKQATLC